MHNRCKALCSAAIIGILAVAGVVPVHGNEWAFTGMVPDGHHGPVSALVHKGNVILSAGEDGFLEIWDTLSAHERFQISSYRIIAMAERPAKDEVCLLESDGMGLYRISAWNYKERRSLFSVRLRDPAGFVSYSAGGNFIIVGMAGLTGSASLILIDPASGELLRSPQSLTGMVSLAVTGRSERNILVYGESGSLSYWDLESGNETSHFNVPAHLHSPALFSNNRYLAGVNDEGLMVINAVSGEVTARDKSIPADSLLCSAGNELICLVQAEKAPVYLFRYTIDRGGRLIRAGSFSIPVPAGAANKRFTAIAVNAAANAAIALGTSGGLLVLAAINGQPRTLAVKEQTGITEAEVSGAVIAFLAQNGTMGFIPLDYNLLSPGRPIPIEQNKEAYTHITAFSGDQFVFWQDRDTKTPPLIRSSQHGGSKRTLDDITFSFPVRSADSFGDKILFLDSTGNLYVVSPLDTTKRIPFTFFSVGLMDAAFVDHNRLIVGRSAVSGNAPFLMLNIDTGETVPLPHPSRAGVIMYRGTSGNIYAAAVFSSSSAAMTSGTRTSILQLDPANIANSVSLVDFQGEDIYFSLVETPGNTAHTAAGHIAAGHIAAGYIAATIGGEGAAIYSASNTQNLERSGGLPLKLIDGKSWLISLDRDGNICWHDNRGGKLLAVFRLHPDGWTLQTERRIVSGGISY